MRSRMDAEGITYRDLEARTRDADPEGRGLTFSYLSGIARHRESPSITSMIKIAQSLGMPPEEFTEYRLAHVRRLFDERGEGFDEASRNLAELEHWIDTGKVNADSPMAALLRKWR